MKNHKNPIYLIISFIIKQINERYYNKQIFNFLKKLNHKIKINVAFDVGSHHGESIDLYLKSFTQLNSLYSFEPYSKSFDILKKKFSNNKKIRLNNIAISNETGLKTLNIVEAEDGQSTLNEMNQESKWLFIKKIFMASKKIYSNKENVKVDKLSNIYDGNIDFLKIDTEGNELKVLKSCNQLIKKTKIIFIEIHHSKMYKNYDSDLIYNFLIDNSFVEIKRFKFPLMAWNDVVFINKELVDISVFDQN